jgi:CxxC motif-containing protein (DUF1111 family)
VNVNSPNGGVEDLFTVSGRPDAEPQSGAAGTSASGEQYHLHIPTPVFGAGLLENLDDSTLLRNQAKNLNNRLGISGSFTNGNDGTISRFGWKAQGQIAAHICG